MKAPGLCGIDRRCSPNPLPASNLRFCKGELMAAGDGRLPAEVVREEITDLNTGTGSGVHAGGGDD